MARFIELVRHEIEVAFRTRYVLVIAALYLLSVIGMALAVTLISRVVRGVWSELGLVFGVRGAELDTTGFTREFAKFVLGNSEDAWMLSDALFPNTIIPLFFALSISFVPLLAVLTCHGALSTDYGRRTLCFTSLRVSRSAEVVARIAAWWLITTVIVSVGTLVFVLLSPLIAPIGVAQGAAAVARLSLGLSVASLPWVTMSVFWSASTARPFHALLLGVGTLFANWIFVTGLNMYRIRNFETAPAWLTETLPLVSPMRHLKGLWLQPGPLFYESILAALFFGLVATLGAIALVRRRDL